MSTIRARVARALPYALPVMAGYVAIGIPSGILEAEVGIAPWMALFLSATFYTGAGQFMLSNLWLAGQAPLAIAASISFVNLRQLLYSAAFAPRLQGVRRGLAALFALTVTDESFGVNMDRFAQADAARAAAAQGDATRAERANDDAMWAEAVESDAPRDDRAKTDAGEFGSARVDASQAVSNRPDAFESEASRDAGAPSESDPAKPWDPADATVLNLLCMSAWALANFAGALVGDALMIPTAVASFAMTAIFICLLFGRDFTVTTVIVAAVSAAGVVLCKAIGWEQPAIIVGAVAGVAAGACHDLLLKERAEVPEPPVEASIDELRYGEPVLDLEALEDAEREVEVEVREREGVRPWA